MKGFYIRLLQVVIRLFPFAVAFARDRRRFLLIGRSRTLPTETHERRAERLVETLLSLGPAFIKVGQVLSTRPDLVSPVYAETLATLQDQVPESTEQDPEAIVRSELGDTVDPSTLASVAGGSLAYVYTAELDGETVALKIRRPNIKPRIERDLRVIRRLVPIVGAAMGEEKQYSIRNIADDFERIILDELDFEREARMMREIGRNFAGDDRVRIPEANESMTTERVLVMEYVEGEPVTDDAALRSRGLEPTEMAERIADVYLTMGLEHGVFHADPHPGNLAVTDDGQLLLYDFGMSERLDPATQERIVDLYRSLARRDIDGLIDALLALEVLEPTADRTDVRRVLALAMQNLEGKSKIGWHDIIEELFEMLHEFPFRIPPNVMLLIRVGTVAEGVCRELDPEFDFVAFVRTFLLERGLFESELRAIVTDVSSDLSRSLPALAALPARADRLLDRLERDEFTLRTERPDDPTARVLGYAILAGAFFVSAAIAGVTARPYGPLAIAGGVVFLLQFLRHG